MKALKKLILFINCMAITNGYAQNIYFNQKISGVTSYSVQNLQNLSFELGSIKVKKLDGYSDLFQISNLNYFNFAEGTSQTKLVQTSYSSDTDLSVFPNPVIDRLSLRFSGIDTKNIKLSIIALDGTVIYSAKINTLNDNYIQLSVDFLIRGMYFCTVESKDKVLTSRFIKL